jgi:hypothetical protein
VNPPPRRLARDQQARLGRDPDHGSGFVRQLVRTGPAGAELGQELGQPCGQACSFCAIIELTMAFSWATMPA